MTPDTRRRLGAWYTPHQLVVHLCDQVIDTLPSHRPIRVLDPSCGDGRFLAEVRRRRPDAYLVGIDVDEGALASAREHTDQLVRADALGVSFDEPFDAVIGNPPYLSQLATVTTRGGRSPLGGGPYADAAALFLARALEWVRADGGHVGLVLPQSILSTRDTRAIRESIAAQAALQSIWVAGTAMFDAGVLTCTVTFERGARRAPIRRFRGPHFEPVAATSLDPRSLATWSPLVADLFGVPGTAVNERPTLATLGSIATATADFRAQFYELAPLVREATDPDVLGDGESPVITCGLIDPNENRWGTVATRIAGTSFLRPVVDRAAMPAFATRHLGPKVLLATQTRVLEAVVDETGRAIPSVPVVSVRGERLHHIAALLSSPTASAWAATHFFGAGLSTASIKLSAKQVLDIPLPESDWSDAAAALRNGDLHGCAALMNAAYGEHTEVYDWWRTQVAGGRRRRRATTDER
ncbi:MAG: trans-aconitate 2-methyltransferase [Acidimicrobiia bacterium]